MYLSCEEKRKIFNSFSELTESISADGRISYIFAGSNKQKKQIERELSYTGNGYIFGEYLNDTEYSVDARGWINIRELNEKELSNLIERVIKSFI